MQNSYSNHVEIPDPPPPKHGEMKDASRKKTSDIAMPRFDGDEIDLNRLLRLVGTRTTTDEFGFLLRPYWIPATELSYEQTTRQISGRGTESNEFWTRVLRPVKIDAERFVWRENDSGRPWNPDLVRFHGIDRDIMLYEYDRAKQTLRGLTVDGGNRIEPEAAFFRLPILVPPLPIPLGFRWHVEDGAARLDFHLESVERLEGRTVLFIRRHGTIPTTTLWRDGRSYRSDEPFVVRRQGICAYALERSVVLEDRTLDVILDPKDGPDGFHAIRILTTNRLVRSSRLESEVAPLFLKYQTSSGKRYLYDCGTGRILSTDAETYRLIDRYGIWSETEIVNNTEPDERETVRTSLEHLDRLRLDGYLAPHEPTESSRVEFVTHGETRSSLTDFWTKYGSLLVLGLTERCNLDCSYCCYSGRFEGQRTHGNRVMSLETAKKAIRQLLDQQPARKGRSPITFYGGEPLLEFDLLRQCVEFAEQDAAERGKQVRFSITTNGTLMNDEVVDFLVEHDFLVLVSLDGCREAHDRYRVFPNGKGSFDLVLRNLYRFAEKYPGYLKRGINVTLAPPLVLKETAELVDSLAPHYPIIRASLVNPGYEYRFDEELRTRYGCSSCTACEAGSPSGEEAFQKFREEDSESLKTMWDAVVESITRYGSDATREAMPMAMALFGPQIALLHRRPVTKRSPERVFFVPCVPGYTRRFCDAGGTYRICERVDNSDAYVIGDVDGGLDPARLERIMEMRRHFGDCGNCTAMKSCDICYARIPGSDAAENAYDPRFDLLCRETRRTHERMLPVYTGIMEHNRDAFDLVLTGETIPSPIPLRFGTTIDRPNAEALKRLKEERFAAGKETDRTDDQR